MNTSDRGSNRVGRYVSWGLLGLIILVGASIATSIIFFAPRSPGTFYPVFPFFPFHFGILGVIFLIFIIFWIARWWLFWPWRERYHTGYREDDAHEILRERYAKGEITKEQFEQMIRDLREHN
jgi:putative membrane protein